MNAVIRDGALRYLRSLEATCDVTIICQHNVKLMAHKIVLGIGSGLLQDILLDCHSCQNMTILLPQVSSKLITLVLDFVYTGSIIVTTENDYKDFLEVAHMLKLHNIDIKSDTNASVPIECKKHHDKDIAKSLGNLQVDNRDDSKDKLKDEVRESEDTDAPSRLVPALVPLVKTTHVTRVKEVRNKVLPSPWKARSPRHVIDWSYSQCRSRYNNDSNNNNLGILEEHPPPRKDDNVVSCRSVGEDVLSLAVSHHPEANTREVLRSRQEEATKTRPYYEQNITEPSQESPLQRYNNERGHHRLHETSSSYENSSKPLTVPLANPENARTPIARHKTTDNNLIRSSIQSIEIKIDGKVTQDRSRYCKTVKTHVDAVEDSSCNSKNEDAKRTKIYTCKECGKTFTQLRNYKYHRSIHDGSGEFAAKCAECGKTFNDRGYLRSHMKIHKDKKEYACNVCPKRFNQRVAYNMHLRIHTGVKPHECSTCGKSFSRKMLLKQHERIHTGEKPFVCPQCGKSFADRSNMMLHARLHTGEKPYTCNICQKSFTKKHHLKTHINFHTGIKPYVCKNCGLTFSQSSNMKTHFKKCNSNGPKDARKMDDN